MQERPRHSITFRQLQKINASKDATRATTGIFRWMRTPKMTAYAPSELRANTNVIVIAKHSSKFEKISRRCVLFQPNAYPSLPYRSSYHSHRSALAMWRPLDWSHLDHRLEFLHHEPSCICVLTRSSLSGSFLFHF